MFAWITPSVAERVRPRRGVHDGLIIPRGMAWRRGRVIHRMITRGMSLSRGRIFLTIASVCVQVCLQVLHVFVSIYVDGAIRTAAAKLMPFTSQHAFELKCWGSVTLW